MDKPYKKLPVIELLDISLEPLPDLLRPVEDPLLLPDEDFCLSTEPPELRPVLLPELPDDDELLSRPTFPLLPEDLPVDRVLPTELLFPLGEVVVPRTLVFVDSEEPDLTLELTTEPRVLVVPELLL